MTGAELLAIARHNCPPGMSDYELAMALVAAVSLLTAGMAPQYRAAVHGAMASRALGWRMTHEDAEL